MTNKKLKLIFLCLLALFVFVFPFKIFAVNLEVAEYPETITGSTVTSQSNLAQYLKYVFDFGMSIGLSLVFLTLVVAGIFYFAAPASPNALAIAKDRISGAISGLLILLLTYLIITTINPYLSIFKMNSLESVNVPVPSTEAYGVNFYKSNDCSNVSATYTENISDLGDLKNKVNSIKISQNADGDIYYISVLYDNTNFWGKCQYINPNTGCQSVNVSTASASIYTYDFSPTGNGVYLYRKSFNEVSGKEENKDGGYLRITNTQIENKGSGALYRKELSSLSFTGEGGDCTVPMAERDCIQWSDTGKCLTYKCPTLDKENITSIKIDGNYLVLLIYIDPRDKGAYSYCQAFPSDDDTNKDGPQQVKWDAIRSSGYEPNYILIIPVKQK